jgi:hypothetical protein
MLTCWDDMQVEQGGSERVTLKVLSPELPKTMAGSIILDVASYLYYDDVTMPERRQEFSFEKIWEFLAPPEPEIVPGSVYVNGEQPEPLWVELRSAGRYEHVLQN